MFKIKCLFICFMVSLVFILPGQAGASDSLAQDNAKIEKAGGAASNYVPDELIVKFAPGTEDENALNDRAGTVKLDENETLGLTKVKLETGADLQKAISEYNSSSSVEYVQPNYIYHALSAPNDTEYWRQWSLPKISAEQAWDITAGDPGVCIAVIDTGVDLNHPDLADNLVDGHNFINELLLPQDDHGHGTHCAGIIAAVTNNNLGVAGLANDCKIMPIKVLDAGGLGSDFDVALGIVWAAEHDAKVISMSLGGSDYSNALADAVNYAYGKNVVIVAAAGNDGLPNISYPAALPNVIAVGATNSSDERASWSNYGSQLDVAAPGNAIFSTVWDDSYVYMSGTSMAAPHVAGLAALVYSLRSDFTNAQVENAIKAGCMDLGDPGWDQYYGYGRIDAFNALEQAAPAPVGSVIGHVYLEGRTDWSGARIAAIGADFSALTDTNGNFILRGLTPGTYDLRIGKDGYLYRQESGITVTDDAVTNLDSIVILLAGDFSLDNIVDVDDLLIIRYEYGNVQKDPFLAWNPIVDVNQDGKIGLADLVYMGRNYAKSGE